MNHSFNIKVAIQYGVEKAIMLENIYFWIIKNKANNKHFYDGCYWTYNSAKAFAELFPYFTLKQINRIINGLIEAELIIIGHYNEHWSDRTRWFTLSEKGHNLFGNPCNDAISQKGKCNIQNGNLHIPKKDIVNCPKGNLTTSQKGNSLLITDINSNINTDINSTPLPPKCGLLEKQKDEIDVNEQIDSNLIAKTQKNSRAKRTKTNLEHLFNYDGFDNTEHIAIEKWFIYRKEIRKPYKSISSLTELRSTLLELKESDSVVPAIRRSIAMQYSGLYSPNSVRKNNSPPKKGFNDFTVNQSTIPVCSF